MSEPQGLWAVISWQEDGKEIVYLVKAPGFYGEPYWYALGSEDGWGWDQVTGWPGTVALVREGVQSVAAALVVEGGQSNEFPPTSGMDRQAMIDNGLVDE